MNETNEKLLVERSTGCFSDGFKSEDKNKKRTIALKLHHQVSHPAAQKLISVLRDVNAEDNELMAIVSDVSDDCEVCFKYGKPKPRPIEHFPLVKRFSETAALELKEWASNT